MNKARPGAKSTIEPRRALCTCVNGNPCTADAVVCMPCFWSVLRELAGLPQANASTGPSAAQVGHHDPHRALA